MGADGGAAPGRVLIRHSLIYVVAKLLPGLLGLATTALLTRLIPPAGYGVYGLALVVMTFGSAAAFDWLGLAYLRLGRPDDPRAIATTVALFGGVVGVVALGGVVAWLAGGLGQAGGIGLVMMGCYAWFELASRFQMAAGRPGRYLAMNLGRAGLGLMGAVTAAWLTRDPVWTAAGTAAGMLAGAALGGVRPGGPVDWRLARDMLGFGLPLAVSLALAGLANSGTRALVGGLGSAEALGLYTAAYLLVQNSLAVVAAGIAAAGYPPAVRAMERGDLAGAQRQLAANGALLLAVLAPMAVGMTLTAPGLAAVLVGPGYVGAVADLTPWMAAAGFFAGMRAQFLDHAFQLGKRPGLQLGVTAGAAVVVVGLTVMLVPWLGVVGAAVAMLVAMAVSCAHAAAVGRRAWPMPVPAGWWRVGLACGVMACVVGVMPGGLAVQVAAGVGSYGGVMGVLWLVA